MFGCCCCFFFQAEDGIRDLTVTGVQTCALPISHSSKTCRPECSSRAVLRGCARTMIHAGRRDDSRCPIAFRRRRSEERRVGKECRSWWWPYQYDKKKKIRLSKNCTFSNQISLCI